MDKSIFSGPAQVAIQGDSVLSLISQGQDHAEYRVIGFDDPITIMDYRSSGLAAIAEVIARGKSDSFALRFNTPAHVNIKSNSKGATIELKDTDDTAPNHMLWIAIGIQDSIPVYDYLFDRLVPLDNDRFGFLGLFRTVPERTPVLAPDSAFA